MLCRSVCRAALPVLLAACVLAPAASAAIPVLDQTIILLRHGEKPASGLGQLSCQGLNRALALPAVLERDFGRPGVIFAPNPSMPKDDDGIAYDYIRPLATIEPSAIRFGLPVNVTYGETEWARLAKLLTDPTYRPPVIVIAWEHHNLVLLARALISAEGGNPGMIPDWDRKDFDSLYVLHIRRTAAPMGVTFEHRQEGLNGEPESCPDAPPR